MPTIVPIVDQSRGYRQWYYDEVYTTPLGVGRYVPNVNDSVWSWELGLHRVTAVDYLTGASTLVPHTFTNNNSGVLATDTMLGSGPGSVSESFRVYIDTTVSPPTLAVDRRLHVYGSDASYVKIFKGTDTGPSGHVVSAMFSGMTLLSENIPLETVVTPGVGVIAVKSVQVGWSIEALADGEVVTCVTYSATDAVLCVTRLLVSVSNFIHTVDTSRRYILGIELISPFISLTNDRLLEYPGNVLVQSDSMLGRVRYSDATHVDLPIDGTRMAVHGMEAYVATVLNQELPIVLVYTLLPNEYSYVASAPQPDRFIAEPYTITTLESIGAYNVKLFVVPRWVSTGTPRWTLDYYLYSLDRDVVIDATAYVQYSPVRPAFNGGLVDVPQTLTVAVNLDLLDPAYSVYRFVQSFTINLKASGSTGNAANYWQIEYTPNHFYGAGMFAVTSLDTNPIYRRLDISMGLVDADDWLSEVYLPIEPLIYANTEYTPPLPTHVVVRIGATWSRELTINDALLLITGITVPVLQGDTVRLEWIKRSMGSDAQLGLSSMTVKL